MMAKLNKPGENSVIKNLYLRTSESSVFQFSTKSVFLGAFFCYFIFSTSDFLPEKKWRKY
ncbi:hypothetical protein ER578_13845 [Enterococcus faecium]|nr:hypothetical protein [Enterococcus faecium]EGP5496624.1 hypothetical protein [Enterococcus faecium]EPI22375.1 hypothetical protein D352_01594 [Enterococcus faecium LA4B-2]PQG47283.1 hypothetical protein CUS80_02760 [Enterococcus faecium]